MELARSSGRAVRLALLLLPATAAADSSVRLAPTPAVDVSTTVLLRARSSAQDSVPLERRLTLSPGEVPPVMGLPGETGWRVEAEAEGYWSSGVTLGSGQVAGLVLYRTTRVTGMASPRATGVGIRLEPRPRDPAPPTMERLPCRVEAAGAFACDVPAGAWGFSIHVAGHAPRYELTRPLSPGGTVPLGRVELVPGASVAGWVTAESHGWDASPAKVYLRPAGKPGPLSLARSAPVAPSGFFQLTEVDPGPYQALATQPEYVTDTRDLEVAGGLETRLPAPLVLREARTLILTIEPPAGPDGAPWEAVIRDSPDAGSPGVVEEAVAYAGRVRFRELRGERRYWLTLRTSSGRHWFTDDEGFLMDQRVMERHLEVGIEKMAGVVLMGRQPLPARVTFGLGTGAPTTLTSDDQGRFEGFLPRLGSWRVRVVSKDERLSREIEVQVARGASSSVAEVDIRLDDFALHGVLVTENGEIFEQRAFVTVSDGHGVPEQHEARDGHFRIATLGPGTYRLYAAAHAVMSRTVEAQLRWNEEPDEVRLVMKPQRGVRLRVVGPTGEAVQGAPIYMVPASAEAWLLAFRMLFTDAEGRLAYDHLGPEETERCLVVYGTIRGYPTRITRVPLGPDETTITLDAVGGRVVTGEHTPGGTWLVHDGCPVTKGYFQRWDPGGFPPLSPGRYDLCPAVTWQPDGRCVGGILPPSGTLHLDLRDAPGLR